MTKLLLIISLLATGLFSTAQSKMLTMEDALVKNKTSLAPASLNQLQFLFGTDDYVYLDTATRIWMKGNVQTKPQAFLTLAELNRKLVLRGMPVFSRMPQIQFDRSTDWIMTINGRKRAVHPSIIRAKLLMDSSVLKKEIKDESKVGLVAYVDDYNLWVDDYNYLVPDNHSALQITTDGSKDVLYGTAVHREEFGITKGTFWSNDGRQLAFYRMDQSMVADYPIIDWSKTPATVENIKYPMAGGKSHEVTVWVYNANNRATVKLATGEPADQYLTNIAWSPDDKFVYIAVLNRAQNNMKLNKYNASDGSFVKTIFEEKDEKYVEPLVPILFVKNNPSQFIWQSNRDGWNHLYLYDVNGNLIKQLTKGSWEVTEVNGFDSKGDLLYISTEGSPIANNLYKLNVKTGQSKKITTGTGIHTIKKSPSGNYVIDAYSDASHAGKIQLIETGTGKTSLIQDAKNPLAAFALGAMEIFTINGSSGTPLYCRLYKPVNFDERKQYPVIVYWYGGPHTQMITAGFNGGAKDYWFQYMAERGYVVFTLDVRGSPNRGKAFEQSIFRKAGDVQMEDMMSGVDYLKTLSYVDKTRMGLFGWSYGGFMTIDFMLHHPGIFSSAVAGGPVTDWKLYEIMYGERYMDTPEENPEGYAATNLSSQVEKLKGNLLIIHGLQDNVVVQQNSVKFVRAAIDKKVQVDYMIYPGHEHNVLGKDREHLYQKVTDWFMEKLGK